MLANYSGLFMGSYLGRCQESPTGFVLYRERAYAVAQQPRGLGKVAFNVGAHAQARMAERGITDTQVARALNDPLHELSVTTDERGHAKKVIGHEVTVVINPDTGKIVTTYPTGKKARRKYGAEQGAGRTA